MLGDKLFKIFKNCYELIILKSSLQSDIEILQGKFSA